MSVAVDHPDLGKFFAAMLHMRRSQEPQLANESAGLRVLWRYGLVLINVSSVCMANACHFPLSTALTPFLVCCRYGFEPQCVTVWIYWQALKLLWRKLHFFEPPTKQQRFSGVKGAAVPVSGCGARFVWRGASAWPWASSQ